VLAARVTGCFVVEICAVLPTETPYANEGVVFQSAIFEGRAR
jgi:hypothetical protein